MNFPAGTGENHEEFQHDRFALPRFEPFIFRIQVESFTAKASFIRSTFQYHIIVFWVQYIHLPTTELRTYESQ